MRATVPTSSSPLTATRSYTGSSKVNTLNNLNLLIIERFLLEFDDKESEQEALESEVNNNAESPSLYQKSLEKLKLLTASSERLDKVAGPELDNTETLA